MEDKVLKKFKKTLEERLKILQSHILTANNSISDLQSENLNDHADVTSANSQGMLNHSLITQYEQETRDIMRSLNKIKDGTFGVCEMCNDDIDEERLWVKPHAKYCIACREIYEKNKG